MTCEVSPHHLFLTKDDADKIGVKRSGVKPALVTAEDQKALWDNIDIIDCFATDHGKMLSNVILTMTTDIPSMAWHGIPVSENHTN